MTAKNMPSDPTADRDRMAFASRHIGPTPEQQSEMLRELGAESLDAVVARSVPASIRLKSPLELPQALSEPEQLALLRSIAQKNNPKRSFIGMGYYDCHTPAVVARNIIENPGWYTQYTPYQAEIAQGRLEALMNFQTVVSDLTGLGFANASLLDEGTAAAEAMTLCHHVDRKRKTRFFVERDCHPQTVAVLRTRAEPAGIELVVGELDSLDLEDADLFGVLLSYPTSSGRVIDYGALAKRARLLDKRVVVATDLLALTLLAPPGEWGADVAIGSSQRFGVPMGFGGPHAAFISTHDKYKRLLPGRIVGESVDAHGALAYRLALQTREQHIRRDRATSNICTAQVLLAIVASFYAVFHGPQGLVEIAERVHGLTRRLAESLARRGFTLPSEPFFDTLSVLVTEPQRRAILAEADAQGLGLRTDEPACLGIALDETATDQDLERLLCAFAAAPPSNEAPQPPPASLDPLRRTSAFLQHRVFHELRSEHELLRYMRRLESRDLSLTTSMIPLGSCTMKLNATSEMVALSWPEFGKVHPFAPREQAAGYMLILRELADMLAEITGMDAVSLQPNAGAQGEYAGLLAIRRFLRAQGQSHRDVCLIPTSAHGTNPATAVMAGMRVVSVGCDDAGNIDLQDLRAKVDGHRQDLAAMMLTYPSTHGVFEPAVEAVCQAVHEAGGLVYLDGANMNAQVGLCRPGDYGADVCHLNLHKTFCIPHGGGGPGMGPIAVKAHLAPYVPGHPLSPDPQSRAGAVSAAEFGSPSILPISWSYIRMMGEAGLRRATQVAILNANYMAHRLSKHFPILYTGPGGGVAHEFIIDLRPLKKTAGVEVDDVAKRLMDCGFHAPTMSFPVPGTLMIEPTESESKAELDRFCDALIAIRQEIRDIEEGRSNPEDNPLKNAPHTAEALLTEPWPHGYPRRQAAYPTPGTLQHKYWPPVGRIDNARGDRKLVSRLPRPGA